jgi:cell division protein FtsA
MLGVPVHIAKPENLVGMIDRLDSPAFSTSVGLLRWAFQYSEYTPQDGIRRPRFQMQSDSPQLDKVKSWLKRLLP